MTATPQGTGFPFERLGWADAGVLGYGIVVRPVEEVRPLVDILGPRLDGFFPDLATFNVRDAPRSEDAHDLARRHIPQAVGHDEVDAVRDVRQVPAVKRVDRHGPVQILRTDVRAGLGHVRSVSVQAMDEVRIPRAQRLIAALSQVWEDVKGASVVPESLKFSHEN